MTPVVARTAVVLGVLALTATATAADLEAGKKLYAQKCASCHGADGKGNRKLEATLKVKIPELAAAAGKSDAELHRLLVEGKKPMPSFAKLTRDEMDAVIAYAKALAGAQAAAK